MPRDPNGNYVLPPIYRAEPGTVIRSEQHNTPLEDMAQAITQSIPRDGRAPMTGNLPMGGRKVTGLGPATLPGDAVRFDQLPNMGAWLNSVSSLTMAADRFPYATSSDAAALAVLTAYARTLLDDDTAAKARTTLEITIADAARVLFNAAAPHNSADWLSGASASPGFPSPAQVRSSSLGVNQRWQNVTSSRVAGQIYTNGTTKPIQVSISSNIDLTRSFMVRESSSSSWVTVATTAGYGQPGHWSIIVPPGHQYMVQGAGAFSSWAELR